MALSLERAREIHDITYKLMTDNGNRNIAFDAYMSMYKSGWDLPPEIRGLPWVQKVINSDPYDAIQTGMRILATIPMSIRYQPLQPGVRNAQRAETIEKVLKWQFLNSNRRRSRTVEAEMAKFALLFDMCAMRIDDLEWEVDRKKSIGASTKREEAKLALGRFRMQPFDSRSIFPLWTGDMLEGVLVVQHRRAIDVVKEWGERASQYEDLVKLSYANYGQDWVTYYEWTDLDVKKVWCRKGQQWSYPVGYGDAEHWVLDEGKNPLPFINWAVLGGSELETDYVHKHNPLLYPVYATGAWDIKNIVQTLGVSEVIAHTGSPRYVEEGPNQQQAQVGYAEPERIAKMPTGNTLKTLPPPQLDAALANVEAMLSNQIDKSTVARILQGGDLPAGTAFATLNLATQTAVGVLSPFKDLTQKVLAQGATCQLQWVAFTGKDLMGYAVGGRGDEENGKQLSIKANELSTDSIYIDVVLHPDTATDKAQKINTAAIAVQQLDMSIETALDEIGIEDPKAEMKKRIFEKMAQHELDLQFQREIQEMQAEIQLATEGQSMQMQMLMQTAMAEQQQAMAAQQQGAQTPPPPHSPGAGGGPPPEEMMQAGPGGPQGQGADPAAGGFPPAGAAPQGAAAGAGNPNQQLEEPA
jgi:hypothetical protein